MRKGSSTKSSVAFQDRMYEEVVWHIDEFGYPPTIRWLAEEMGIVTSNALYHLNKLEERGLLVREAHISRGIRIVRDSI